MIRIIRTCDKLERPKLETSRICSWHQKPCMHPRKHSTGYETKKPRTAKRSASRTCSFAQGSKVYTELRRVCTNQVSCSGGCRATKYNDVHLPCPAQARSSQSEALATPSVLELMLLVNTLKLSKPWARASKGRRRRGGSNPNQTVSGLCFPRLESSCPQVRSCEQKDWIQLSKCKAEGAQPQSHPLGNYKARTESASVTGKSFGPRAPSSPTAASKGTARSPSLPGESAGRSPRRAPLLTTRGCCQEAVMAQSVVNAPPTKTRLCTVFGPEDTHPSVATAVRCQRYVMWCPLLPRQKISSLVTCNARPPFA